VSAFGRLHAAVQRLLASLADAGGAAQTMPERAVAVLEALHLRISGAAGAAASRRARAAPVCPSVSLTGAGPEAAHSLARSRRTASVFVRGDDPIEQPAALAAPRPQRDTRCCGGSSIGIEVVCVYTEVKLPMANQQHMLISLRRFCLHGD